MNKITTVVNRNASTNSVAVVGIDLARNIFALQGINAAGKAVLVRPNVRRVLLPPSTNNA